MRSLRFLRALCVSALKFILQTPREPAPHLTPYSRCGGGSIVLSMGSSRKNPTKNRALQPVATASHNLIKGWHLVEAVNRKLIRPSLNEIKEQIAPPRRAPLVDRKSTRLNSSHANIS